MPRTTPIPIDSIDDPRIEIYRNQRDAWLRARHNPKANPKANPQANPHADPHTSNAVTGTGLPGGLFMAESELVVRELIRSEYHIESVLVSPTRGPSMHDALEGLPERVPVYEATREVMAEVTGFDIHRGVLAAGRRGPPTDPQSLLKESGLVVALEDLANHDNVGGIFRSIGVLVDPDKHGKPGVLLSPRCCDPLYRKALRVSIGHALHVPHTTAPTWETLGETGYTTLALTPSPDAVPLNELSLDPGAKVALMLGAEGPGLREDSIAMADHRVRIPQRPGADSLNVVVAGSIVLSRLCG